MEPRSYHPRTESRLAGSLVALALLLPATSYAAPGKDPKAKAEAQKPEDEELKRARALYGEGLELVKKAQWSDALSAFERSYALRPHAMTTYNIGACERALGRYTRARVALLRALAEEQARPEQLPPSQIEEAKGYVAEIERILAQVAVTLEPSEAGIAVDGRPLEAGAGGTLVAGIATPGAGKPPASGKFELVLDPGAHLITLTRKGYADVVVNRTFTPGQRGELRLELEKLPATLHVSSSVERAIVTVNDVDVGMAPVDVQRRAGTYRVVVKRQGFHPYQAQVVVNAGEETDLRAALVAETTPVTKKWWFWTAATVIVAGAAATTYYATRTEPDPRRPALDGGSLGWAAQIR